MRIPPVLINNVMIFPPRYFDPYATGTSKFLLCEDTISIHHYSTTWMSKKTKLRKKITFVIGSRILFILKSIFIKFK